MTIEQCSEAILADRSSARVLRQAALRFLAINAAFNACNAKLKRVVPPGQQPTLLRTMSRILSSSTPSDELNGAVLTIGTIAMRRIASRLTTLNRALSSGNRVLRMPSLWRTSRALKECG